MSRNLLRDLVTRRAVWRAEHARWLAPPSAAVTRFPPRAMAAVFVCPEREGEGWVTLAGSHCWLCGSLSEARTVAAWLSRNLGGLPIRGPSP